MQDEWLRRAELALQKGDEELAREALKRKKAFQVSRSRNSFAPHRQLMALLWLHRDCC